MSQGMGGMFPGEEGRAVFWELDMQRTVSWGGGYGDFILGWFMSWGGG